MKVNLRGITTRQGESKFRVGRAKKMWRRGRVGFRVIKLSILVYVLEKPFFP